MSKANIKLNLPKSGKQGSKLDLILWVLVFLLFFIGICATYYYRELAAPLKLSIWILLLLISVGLISKTAVGKTLLEFGKKARVELRKVVWPTRQTTIQVTLVVGLIVVIMSLILWMIDSGVIWLASLVTGQRL